MATEGRQNHQQSLYFSFVLVHKSLRPCFDSLSRSLELSDVALLCMVSIQRFVPQV